MKRYYLSKIIGDGQSPETAYRPALADVPGVSYVAEYATDNTTGAPLTTWAICLVSGNKHGLIMADHQQNRALPDASLDLRMTAINNPARTKLTDDFAEFGISNIPTNDGFRDVIRALGRQHNPNFDENNFDVSE